jgi:hypothetical protein
MVANLLWEGWSKPRPARLGARRAERPAVAGSVQDTTHVSGAELEKGSEKPANGPPRSAQALADQGDGPKSGRGVRQDAATGAKANGTEDFSGFLRSESQGRNCPLFTSFS